MRILSGDTYYDLLGLKSDCSSQEISKAYKKLALEYHPDKNKENKEVAEENFKKICEAYEVLSDEEKRHQYDSSGGTTGASSSGFSWEQAEDVFERACSADGPPAASYASISAAPGQ